MASVTSFMVKSVAPSSSPPLPKPLIPLPPPLSPMPRSLLFRRHPPGDVAPRQRQQRLDQPLAKLNPERGPLCHEERPGPKAKEHDRNCNTLLPAHAQTNFLLGMAQTSTGVMRPMMVAMVSGVAQDSCNPVTPGHRPRSGGSRDLKCFPGLPNPSCHLEVVPQMGSGP